jgi:hypothetical protein
MVGYWAANREDPSKDRTSIAMGRCVRSECESNGKCHGVYEPWALFHFYS